MPLGSTLESGGKKQGKAEGRIRLDHWPDDLSWPHESLEWRWPFRVVLTHSMTRPLYLHLDGSLHLGCTHRAWWFKVTYWQHLQLLDNKSLKGGQDSTSPCSPLGMYHSSRGRWWGCTVGETLDDWCLRQNDDSTILLNTLWAEKVHVVEKSSFSRVSPVVASSRKSH